MTKHPIKRELNAKEPAQFIKLYILCSALKRGLFHLAPSLMSHLGNKCMNSCRLLTFFFYCPHHCNHSSAPSFLNIILTDSPSNTVQMSHVPCLQDCMHSMFEDMHQKSRHPHLQPNIDRHFTACITMQLRVGWVEWLPFGDLTILNVYSSFRVLSNSKRQDFKS